MSNNIIIDKTSPSSELSNAGGKASNLHILTNNKLPVPAWFCLSSIEFEKAVEKNKIIIKEIFENTDFTLKESIEQASEKLKSVIDDYILPDEAVSIIESYMQSKFCQYEYFAVRSSALGEDSQSNSFAGQLDSFLSVQKKDIYKYIKECWKSTYNQNLLYYCYSKKIDIFELKTGVIIQQMVKSKISGVLFTANPFGMLNEAVIVAGLGLGEGVVSDKVDTSTYYFNKSEKCFRYTGNNVSILSDSKLQLLLSTSDKIQKFYNSYQDVEWSFDENDTLHILQSRPITNLPEGDVIILDNSNIVESYPGISSPLTFSFAREAYFNIFRRAVKKLGAGEKLLISNDHLLQNMLGYINGRIYYNLTTWYGIFSHMPLSSKFISVWQEMLGVSDKTLSSSYEISQKLGKFHTFKVFLNLLWSFVTLDSSMKKLFRKFDEIMNIFNKTFHPNLNNDSLFNLYFTIKNKMNNGWELTLLNDIYSFVFSAFSKSIIKKLNIKDSSNMFNDLLCGISGMESLKPLLSIVRMSELVRSNSSLFNGLDLLNFEAINANPILSKMFNEHLGKYGDRSFEELKLETKTFREDPTLLIKRIIDFSKTDVTESQILNDQQSIRKNAENAIKQKLKYNIWGKFIYKFAFKNAIRSICYRESSRLNRARFFGMVRKIFITFGCNFAEAGIIDSTDDIFYLDINEIFNFVRGCSINADLKAVINLRKEAEAEYKKTKPLSRLVCKGTIYNNMSIKISREQLVQNITIESTLMGTGCSHGTALGEVVIVKNAAHLTDVKGKILVTEMTDPGWVFLIATANGIIVEKGSMLSHTAIIARELGIPAIVGVKNATTILKDGDKVKINGNTGEIKIC